MTVKKGGTGSLPFSKKGGIELTIQKIIDLVDATKPNAYTETEKIEWISQLDGTVFEEVIKTHENQEAQEQFKGYTAETPKDTKLLVDFPYDDMYRHWLYAQIDYSNGEYDKYQNDMIMFNSAFLQFTAFYNSRHMPNGGQFML